MFISRDASTSTDSNISHGDISLIIYSIYVITNTVNDKHYVGFTQDIETRRARHFKYNQKSNAAIHRAIRKYGPSRFTFDIVYQSKDRVHTLETMEPHFIAEYNSLGDHGYNMTVGGEGCKVLKLSVSHKNKISQAKKGDKNPMFGRSRTGETHTFTDEGLSAVKAANSCQVRCEGVLYESVADAQKSYPGVSIRKRLDSSRYPEFVRMRERTRRYSHTANSVTPTRSTRSERMSLTMSPSNDTS